NLLCLTEPVHQQGHGGTVVILAQERVNDQREGFGTSEAFDMLPPKGEVRDSPSAPGLVPLGEGGGYMFRGVRRFAAVDTRHTTDLVCGKPVPPCCEFAQVAAELLTQRFVAGGGRFAHQPAIEKEKVQHDLEQLFDPRIVHAVFHGLEKWVLSLK